jgi:hypothetical protein
MLIPSQISIHSYSIKLSGEAANTNFIVFDLTRQRLEPMIYRAGGEHVITPLMKMITGG